MMQICTHVTRAGGDEGLQVQSMADRMVQYARACMMSITRVSPFESESFFVFFWEQVVMIICVRRLTQFVFQMQDLSNLT